VYTKSYHQKEPLAVESNAARSPTRAGQHPNTVQDDRNYNPQQMYERPHAGNTLVNGAPPPKKEEGGFWSGALLMAAVLGFGYMLLKDDRDSFDEDERLPLRRNPGYDPYQPVPAPPTVVVIPPSGVNVTAQMPQQPQQLQAPQPQIQLPASFLIPQLQIEKKTIDQDLSMIPQPVVQQAPVVEVVDVSVEDAASKKPRTRRTTQARDEEGQFMPAGTRARAVIEGKG
jgi:hypothetical protein